MPEQAAHAPLVLPDAQLYIVVAIFMAITAIVSADIRDERRILPQKDVNIITVFLGLGSWIAALQIICSIYAINIPLWNWSWTTAHAVFHVVVLLLLLIVVTLWYCTIARYKPAPAGNPAASEQDS